MMSTTKKIFYIVLLLFITVSGLCAYLIRDYAQKFNAIPEEINRAAQIQVSNITQSIDTTIKDLTQQIITIARNITTEKITPEQILELLKQQKFAGQSLFGAGIAWAPFAYKSSQRLYAPYIAHEDHQRSMQLETYYDYTKSEWFISSFQKSYFWSEPFIDTVTKILIIRLSVPFFKFDPSTRIYIPQGVIFVDIPITVFDSVVEQFIHDSSIFSFLISSQKGNILSHPFKEYIRGLKNLNDLAEYAENRYLRDFALEISKHENGIFVHTDVEKGIDLTIFYERLKTPDWIIGIVHAKNITTLLINTMYHNIINIILLIALWSILLVFLLSHFYIRTTVIRLWVLSSWIAMMAIPIIGLIWFFNLRYVSQETRQVKIVDRSGLNQFLRLNAVTLAKEGLHEGNITHIPTGVFIKSLIIDSKGGIQLTGNIWQKYSTTEGQTIEQGCTILNAESFSATLSNKVVEQKQETIAWDFKATLIQPLNYRYYPLDRQIITIVIAPKDQKVNIILIPDFKIDYKSRLYGINPNLTETELSFQKTYFSYVNDYYGPSYGRKKSLPDLTFNIITTRELLYPIVLIFLPIATIFILLFAIVLLLSSILARSYTIISINSAILFAMVLAHQRLKMVIPTNVISYAEYIYFFTYALISLVMLVCFLSLNIKDEKQNELHNLLARLAYWPFVMLGILLITLFFFY